MYLSVHGLLHPLGKATVAATVGEEIIGQKDGMLCQGLLLSRDDIIPQEDAARWYAILELLHKSLEVLLLNIAVGSCGLVVAMSIKIGLNISQRFIANGATIQNLNPLTIVTIQR